MHVGAHDGVEIYKRKILKWCTCAENAGVVERSIETTEFADSGSHGPLDVCLFGDVCLDGESSSSGLTDACNNVVELVLVASDQCNSGASSTECLCCGSAYAR